MTKPKIVSISTDKFGTWAVVDGKKTKIGKFLVKERRFIATKKADGSEEKRVELLGWNSKGDLLPKLSSPANTTELVKRIQSAWGAEVQYNPNIVGMRPSELARLHAERILRNCSKLPKVTRYEQPGFYSQIGFVTRSGTIHQQGLDRLTACHPPTFRKVDNRTLPLKSAKANMAKLIGQVLGVSEPRPALHFMPLIAILRGIMCSARPSDGALIFVGDDTVLMTALANLAPAWLRVIERDAVDISLDASKSNLERFIASQRHGVAVIEDLTLPGDVTATKACGKKLGQLLVAGQRDHDPLMSQTQLILVGRAVPTLSPLSLMDNLLIFPIASDGLEASALDEQWDLAEKGVYFRVMRSYLRYWLQDMDQHRERFSDYYARHYLPMINQEFPANPGLARHIASLLAVWRHFLGFAIKKNAITEETAKTMHQNICTFLSERGAAQCQMNTVSPMSGLTSALREGLAQGFVHLTDSQTGLQPAGDGAALGWRHGAPQGLHLGWYSSNDDMAYLTGEVAGQPTHQILANLMFKCVLPRGYEYDIGAKKFWKEARVSGLLAKSEENRSTARASIKGEFQYVYWIRLGLRPNDTDLAMPSNAA